MAEGTVNTVSFDVMRLEDLPEILVIERLSATMPWTERLFLNEINNPRSAAIVARADSGIAGYICAGFVLDEGNILNVAVGPDFRRQGIASEMISRMIDQLIRNGCRSIFLEVRASNEAAIRVYGKAGFGTLGTRKRYYTSPVEDALIMSFSAEASDHQKRNNLPLY